MPASNGYMVSYLNYDQVTLPGFSGLGQINVQREGTCGGGDSGEEWQTAYAEVAATSPEIKV